MKTATPNTRRTALLADLLVETDHDAVYALAMKRSSPLWSSRGLPQCFVDWVRTQRPSLDLGVAIRVGRDKSLASKLAAQGLKGIWHIDLPEHEVVALTDAWEASPEAAGFPVNDFFFLTIYLPSRSPAQPKNG